MADEIMYEVEDGELEGVSGGGKTYKIQRGDTLTKIANRFGVSKNQLMRWNRRITDPDFIMAGWVIRVG